jgi:hypothetical protein
MKLKRTVIRFPSPEREGLDRLRARYFAETKRRVSRAAVVRILVRRGLADAEGKEASAVFRPEEIAESSFRQRGEGSAS